MTRIVTIIGTLLLMCANTFAAGTAGGDGITVSGTVQSVDANAMQLTVQDGAGEPQEFVLQRHSVVRKGGRSLNLSEVKAGDRVTVTASRPQKGRCVAETVTVHAPEKSPMEQTAAPGEHEKKKGER